MVMTSILLATTLALTGPQSAGTPQVSDAAAVQLSGFVVALIDDVNVPARESGTLTELTAKLGQLVSEGDVLGRIDDSDAEVRRLIAESQLKVAAAQAASDANLRAAKATVGVAEGEYKESLEMRQRASDSISDFELRRKKLTHERSVYEAVNAEVELRVNALTKDVRAAQLQAVENEIQRRRVTSPINGVIEKRMRDPGEWVQAGDPIYRVVRMDRLRVEGLLDAERFSPTQVEGHPVAIEIHSPDGTAKVQTRITFVSHVVDAGGDFLVYAEFDNPIKPDGQWLVRPGLKANITILLQPQVADRTGR